MRIRCSGRQHAFRTFRPQKVAGKQNNYNMKDCAKRLYEAAVLLMAVLTVTVFMGSCRDEVDESDMYSFTGMQVIDFLNQNDSTTKFAYLATKVRLSKKSASTVAELLSARGNYTCFAPTNEAVQNYLDSVYNQKNYPIEQCPDSTAEQIVNNSLIDNLNSEAFLSTAFQVGSLERPSFSDRFLTIRFDTLQGGKLGIYVNTRSLIISTDNELENGVVHIVDRVITPSNETISALISTTDNLRVFAYLLRQTGWDKKTMKFRDEAYEEDHPKEGQGCPTERTPIPCPDHRNTGYTIFAEPDSVLMEKWNLPEFQYAENGDLQNWDEIMAVVREKCAEYYPAAKDADLKSEDNAVNQFVSYHILPEAIMYNQLVIHFNEQGYGFKNPSVLGINAWEYYETLGKGRRLLKITEGKTTEGKRINRYVSQYDNSNYNEIEVPRKGVLIEESNGGREYNALNGYYYALDDVLVYDEDVPNKVLNERMRYDICALLPEQITNGLRRIMNSEDQYNMPRGYFENMTWTAETNVTYLAGFSSGWRNYQGDEYNIQGLYDVTVKLPPVPFSGTYQLRYMAQNVSTHRSMCQFYFGENKENLPAVGLPLDMRISADIPSIGWVADDARDPDANDENDRVMAMHEYMKAPRYYGTSTGSTVTSNLRGDKQCMRRIILTTQMEPEKTYYLRMKSVLDDTSRQLYIDFFELVPKSVYNGVYAEDKW